MTTGQHPVEDLNKASRWSVAELQQTGETVWPERLIEMLESALN